MVPINSLIRPRKNGVRAPKYGHKTVDTRKLHAAVNMCVSTRPNHSIIQVCVRRMFHPLHLKLSSVLIHRKSIKTWTRLGHNRLRWVELQREASLLLPPLQPPIFSHKLQPSSTHHRFSHQPSATIPFHHYMFHIIKFKVLPGPVSQDNLIHGSTKQSATLWVSNYPHPPNP